MDLPVEQLEKFGLEEFINGSRFTLCTETTTPHRIATFLQFDLTLIENINALPDLYSKNAKLYEYISKKRVTVKNFMAALKETGNEHVIEFIHSTLNKQKADSSKSHLSKADKQPEIWFNIPEPIDSVCSSEYFPSQPREIHNKICDGGKSNLMVFDNAEDYQSREKFFPFGLDPDLTKPVILATSRNKDWISPTGKIQVLPLDKMTEDESLEFISKQLEIPESDIPEFREEAKEFIELIGGLPLALQQAVAYIKLEKELKKFLGKSYKIGDYVKEFKLSMGKFLSFSPVPDFPDSSPTVFVTWNVTFQKIQKLAHGEEAVKILAHLSFLYAEKIPSSFLRDLVPEIKDAEFSGALELLEKYSLIKMNVRDFCLSIHRKLQFVILQYLKERDDVSNVVMNIVGKSTVVLKNINLSKSSDIFLNVHQIVKNPFNLITMTEKFLDFMYEFGMILSKASRHSESLELFKKVYSKRLELLGENHENTLVSQHQIALQLSKLGKYYEAMTLFEENLQKQEIIPDFGLDHPDTIASKHDIASVLRQQEKYDESLHLLQQVLTQRKKLLGENHPETFSTQNQIALVHSNLGHLSEALTMFEELEKKQTEILGPDHRDILVTKHNKATVLYSMDKFEEAAKIFNEVHEKEKKILGENHLDTINTLSWLAETLEEEGKFTEALDSYTKVYESRKDILGENHENTFAAQYEMALQLQQLEKYDEALTLFKKVLEKEEAHPDFGVDHPSTIPTKYNIALVLQKQEKYDESLELLQLVLAQENKIHGENGHHPEILTTQNEIASLYLKMGYLPQALTLYEELKQKRTEILGPHHPKVLQTKQEKAAVLFRMGQFEKASKIFVEVYEKEEKNFGGNHLKTSKNLEVIAEALEKEEKLTEALNLYKKVYEIRKTKLGVDHPETIQTKQNMAIVLQKMKKYGESLELFQQVFDQLVKIHGENHPETLSAQNQIGLVHSERGHFSAALALFEDIEQKWTEIVGPNHINVLQTKFNKAVVFFKKQKLQNGS